MVLILIRPPFGMARSDRVKGDEARAVEEGCPVSDGFVKKRLDV